MTDAVPPGPVRPAAVSRPADQVMVAADDALLILHVLHTFERLLRHGNLSDEQLDLLTPDNTGAADAAADLLMADVVSEASEALRTRLDQSPP